jgi:hypothetical protein
MENEETAARDYDVSNPPRVGEWVRVRIAPVAAGAGSEPVVTAECAPGRRSGGGRWLPILGAGAVVVVASAGAMISRSHPGAPNAPSARSGAAATPSAAPSPSLPARPGPKGGGTGKAARDPAAPGATATGSAAPGSGATGTPAARVRPPTAPPGAGRHPGANHPQPPAARQVRRIPQPVRRARTSDAPHRGGSSPAAGPAKHSPRPGQPPVDHGGKPPSGPASPDSPSGAGSSQGGRQ